MIATGIRRYALAALSCLLFATPLAYADEIYERDIEVSSGERIELRMPSGGSVDAEGWDQDTVRIVCTEDYNDLEDYEIEIKETGSGLHFFAEPKRGFRERTNLKVELMVPRHFDIKVDSAGGSIHIEGVEGRFSGRTGGGTIFLREVTGHADLKTGGGQIRILDSELDGRVSTGGSEGLVRNVVGDVKVTSGGGIVSYENVRSHDGELRGPSGINTRHGLEIGTETIMHTTAGGAISLSEAPEGAIVKTGGGNIRIQEAARFVQAETGGGNIRIEILDGSVVARTGAGDIDVVVTGGLGDGDEGVDLNTGQGDITLVLPEDISVKLRLDLAYTRNSSRDYEILSDFELEREHTNEWDSSDGSPRKHIYGTATLGGGDVTVTIRCVNGNIHLKSR